MGTVAGFIALNRFGLGAGPGELDRVSSAPKDWLRAQVHAGATRSHLFEGLQSSAEIFKDIHEARIKGVEELKKMTGKKYQKNFREELILRAQQNVESKTPLAERMVLFWSNHFTVSRTRATIGPIIPAYEREAIRPHVFGRFEDMLQAAIRHVAMLTYLDNVVSVGANSQVGRRRKKKMNENLAREILELHTLGVNGGYGQKDVEELAKALTGWSHGGIGGKRQLQKRGVHGGFQYVPQVHEPGPKNLLGRAYPENGEAEVKAMLRDLAEHPSTARFVATKLVRHFVSDNPPERAIRQLSQVYMNTGGDLAALTLALIDLDEAWQQPLAKFKTPYELMISAVKGVGYRQVRLKKLSKGLDTLGHSPFNAPSPQGWSDEARHWLTPEGLMRRIEWMRAITSKERVKKNPLYYLDQTVGPVASDELRQMVGGAATGVDGLALLLSSAEFQRR